ncbi:MAG: 23S rRNA (pseudouridine(1915)-N(3))-methyltransferase RlmH [Mycoplasmatales bacterium]|nr:23S rRNA (pseudouridine(1915)-N(3))-methyltransferase RlmH [Mycoplasmatales bacterium]
MKFNIVAVGKLSNEYEKIFNDYKKKINFYSSINVIELKEVKEKNIEIKKNKETEIILKAIPKNSKVIYCSTTGKQITSEEFSNFFKEDNITFVIGGSNGVDESKFENKLNFSKMTFPHQLFRVILIEQIFRAFSIMNNSKYHK